MEKVETLVEEDNRGQSTENRGQKTEDKQLEALVEKKPFTEEENKQEYLVAPLPVEATSAVSDLITPEAHQLDTVSQPLQESHNIPPSRSWDMDLSGLVSTLSHAIKGTSDVWAHCNVPLHITEDEAGVNVNVPKSTLEVLKSFRPLLEGLLKLTG